MSKDKKKNKNEVNAAMYNIILLEKLGGTVRQIGQPFEAERYRDNEDHVVYLRNNSKKFLEIFPQQVNDFKNYTEKEVDELIKKYQKILEKERDKDTENINDKNIEFELLKLKAKKRSFKFGSDSSYLSFGENGRPTFHFLREGSTFFPFKWDTDTRNIFVPSDNRKKSASISLRNKENKYNTKSIITGSAIILIIIGLLFAGGGGYFFIKGKNAYAQAFEDYEASNIAEAKRQCLEDINSVTGSIKETANSVNKIANNVESKLNQPQTVIDGVIPE